jgi:hypothetical protein
LSRVINLKYLSLQGIVHEMNETLKRKEQARIYYHYRSSGQYPPRRGGTGPPPDPAEQVVHRLATTTCSTDEHLQ